VLITNRKGFSRVRKHDELLEFERLFAPRGAHGRFEPNTDVHLEPENGALVVHVELAGADAESLRVALDDTYLLIAGARTARDISRTASLLRREIQYGEFVKRIHLPVPIRDDGASAVYRDGILTIRLPLADTQTFPIVRTEIRMTVRRTPA
jgi:HSP20 family protein